MPREKSRGAIQSTTEPLVLVRHLEIAPFFFSQQGYFIKPKHAPVFNGNLY
jgi:hypothetical protein